MTGVGLVCPLGAGESAWAALRSGTAGAVRELPVSDRHEYPPRLAGAFVPAGTTRFLSSPATFLHAATAAALRDASGDVQRRRLARRLDLGGARTGWVFGASKSDPQHWSPPGRVPWPWVEPDGSHVLCDRLLRGTGLKVTGPRLTPVAACATGVVAVARGADLIRQGICDRVICGAADGSLDSLILTSFYRLGVLADPGDDPAACVRPFDADRSGFAVGEGAAAFVLERADLAAPGACYATVTGMGLASAATKLTDVDATGDPVRRVLRDCTGGVAPDLLSLHGTATRANDPAEAAGVRAAFPHGHAVPAFGSKGATGHLLGAAGAVELAFTLLALRDGVVPPTLNLRRQDPACGLNLSAAARPAPLATAAKVSLGFGGTVAAVALRRGDRAAAVPQALTHLKR